MKRDFLENMADYVLYQKSNSSFGKDDGVTLTRKVWSHYFS